MTRNYCLAAALAALVAGPALAQVGLPGRAGQTGDPQPVYKYELKPEHAEYLVYVKAYLAQDAHEGKSEAKELAEGLAEWIRTECRLYAFVHERGWLQRREQEKEKEKVVKAIRDNYGSRGEPEEAINARIKREVKYVRIPDEYVVFVAPGKGTLKSFDEAREFAQYVHKLPCPPGRFCDAVFIGAERDVAKKKGDQTNPFEMAMPCRNPTLPKKEQVAKAPKEEIEFLSNLNAGHSYSLIHNTRKPITLVVQSYGSKQGAGRLVKPGEVVQASGPASGEMLERAAQQATALAEVLRKQDPPYPAYVLHTRFESFVCVGEYDSKEDEKLLFLQKKLANWQLKDKKGQVIETLMEKPMPAMIPRP